MRNLIKQLVAVSRIALLGLPSRARMSSATVCSVALATLVLLSFLAMAAGFRTTLKGSGSDRSAILLAEGASSEFNSALDASRLAQLDNAPGIARNGEGAMISPETISMISAVETGGEESSVTLRGMGAQGLAVRPLASLIQGRMFVPGRNELVVGDNLSQRYRDLKFGQSIKLAGLDWKIVGIFGANGSAMESEIWADQKLVAQFFGAGTAVQSVRVRLAAPDQLGVLQRHLQAKQVVKLAARSERDYYAEQARKSGKLILFIGWPLGIAMAVGALAGALNTMFTSVSARADEIKTLRVLGFRGPSIFVSTMAEAIALVLAGAGIGVILAMLLLHGRGASTIGGNLTQIAFKLDLTAADIIQAVWVALIVGTIGGAIPAWRAARQPLTAPE